MCTPNVQNNRIMYLNGKLINKYTYVKHLSTHYVKNIFFNKKKVTNVCTYMIPNKVEHNRHHTRNSNMCQKLDSFYVICMPHPKTTTSKLT